MDMEFLTEEYTFYERKAVLTEVFLIYTILNLGKDLALYIKFYCCQQLHVLLVEHMQLYNH